MANSATFVTPSTSSPVTSYAPPPSPPDPSPPANLRAPHRPFPTALRSPWTSRGTEGVWPGPRPWGSRSEPPLRDPPRGERRPRGCPRGRDGGRETASEIINSIIQTSRFEDLALTSLNVGLFSWGGGCFLTAQRHTLVIIAPYQI